MDSADDVTCESESFVLDGAMVFASVEDDKSGSQWIRLRVRADRVLLDELESPVTRTGCAIESIHVSPRGGWLVTQRNSGQGEWGFDLIRTRPLRREGGVAEEYGYMLDPPAFSADDARLVGGYGQSWRGGWWADPSDDISEPARGGQVTFGTLFVYDLTSQQSARHELVMDMPAGWLTENEDDFDWAGPRHIAPSASGGVSMALPGGVTIEVLAPLGESILLPTPSDDGQGLVSALPAGIRLC